MTLCCQYGLEINMGIGNAETVIDVTCNFGLDFCVEDTLAIEYTGKLKFVIVSMLKEV